MEPTYFEVMFSRSGAYRREYFRVYIELNSNDIALSKADLSPALKTRLLVQRAAVLDLLPDGLNNTWDGFGKIMDHGFRAMGTKPTIRAGRENVWIIPEVYF